MSHATSDPKPARIRLVVVLAALLVVIGLVIYALARPDAPVAGPSASPVPTTSAPPVATAAPSSPSVTTDPALAGCTAVSEGFVPTRYTIERFGVDEPIVALDLDDQGNIAAPPKDEPRLASWWSGGPMPGSEKGRAVMTIHTYRNGGALGNELFADGRSQFQPGDVIKLHGGDGQVLCYGYTDSLLLAVDDYDPDSTVMVDFEGDPSLSIIICWDFEKLTELWLLRVFFNFKPVTLPSAS